MSGGGRRNYRQQRHAPNNRGFGGVGRGRAQAQNDDADYFVHQVPDEEAEVDLRIAVANYEQRQIDRESGIIRSQTSEAAVQHAGVQRARETVRLGSTRARVRRSTFQLRNEERQLALEEQLAAIEEQFLQP